MSCHLLTPNVDNSEKRENSMTWQINSHFVKSCMKLPMLHLTPTVLSVIRICVDSPVSTGKHFSYNKAKGTGQEGTTPVMFTN